MKFFYNQKITGDEVTFNQKIRDKPIFHCLYCIHSKPWTNFVLSHGILHQKHDGCNLRYEERIQGCGTGHFLLI